MKLGKINSSAFSHSKPESNAETLKRDIKNEAEICGTL